MESDRGTPDMTSRVVLSLLCFRYASALSCNFETVVRGGGRDVGVCEYRKTPSPQGIPLAKM